MERYPVSSPFSFCMSVCDSSETTASQLRLTNSRFACRFAYVVMQIPPSLPLSFVLLSFSIERSKCLFAASIH